MIQELELIKMIKTLPLSERKVLVKSKLFAGQSSEYPAIERGYGFLIETVNADDYRNYTLQKLEEKHEIKINYLFYLSNGNDEREFGCYICLDLYLISKQLKLFGN